MTIQQLMVIYNSDICVIVVHRSIVKRSKKSERFKRNEPIYNIMTYVTSQSITYQQTDA